MSKSAPLFIITLACSTVLLTGALSPQSTATTETNTPLFRPQSTPTDAAHLLDEVIASLTPSPTSRGLDWLSMTIWQRMTDGENSFEAEGRLWRGPNQRIRLELDVKSQKRAKITHTCDGVTLRQLVQVGNEEPLLSTYLLPADGAPATAAEREAFLEQHGIADFLPLLRRLREGMKNPRQQTGLWQDLPAICISGEWSPRDDTPADLRPPLRPRACHVYLDAATRWPFRIEWWGSEKPSQSPRLLLQMEFRDVVANQPISPEVFSSVGSSR
jgi:hypothetical protein